MSSIATTLTDRSRSVDLEPMYTARFCTRNQIDEGYSGMSRAGVGEVSLGILTKRNPRPACNILRKACTN